MLVDGMQSKESSLQFSACVCPDRKETIVCQMIEFYQCPHIGARTSATHVHSSVLEHEPFGDKTPIWGTHNLVVGYPQ